MAERLTVADVVGVHGIRGWVKLRCYVEDPTSLTGYPELDVVPGPRLRHATPLVGVAVKQVRLQGKGVIAQLSGVDDRNGAEALRGYQLVIDAAALPPAGENEFYWRDLEGLQVWCRPPTGSEDPQLLGVVDYLLATGANDVLVVKATDESIDDRERLIPWLPGTVVAGVDIEGGWLQVLWHPDD